MSDQDTSIFNKTVQTSEQTNEAQSNGVSPSQDSTLVKTLLGEIKNENGQQKYNSLEDALKALKHSQEFIPQLKNENQTFQSKLESLQSEVEKLRGVEATVNQLLSNQSSTPTSAPSLDENAITKLVQQTLSKREVEALQQANVTKVVQSVQAKFGTEAEKVFYTKAQELGMSIQQMNALAASSPAAVLNLLGVQSVEGQKQTMPSTVPPGINTAGFQPKQDSYIGRNQKKVEIGATSRELSEELNASRKMIEELAQQGMSVDDLSNPRNYFKLFK